MVATPFQYGALSTAVKEGHILIMDEMDVADPAELAGLYDLLDGAPLVLAQNGGEIIPVHSRFRFVATGNSAGAGDGSGLYQGMSSTVFSLVRPVQSDRSGLSR